LRVTVKAGGEGGALALGLRTRGLRGLAAAEVAVADLAGEVAVGDLAGEVAVADLAGFTTGDVMSTVLVFSVTVVFALLAT